MNHPAIAAAAFASEARYLGSILVETGKLTAFDAERIAQAQRGQGLRFGEAGVRLGLVQQEDVREALALQYEYPCLAPDSGAVSCEVFAAHHPSHPAAEALRQLRTQLVFRGLNSESCQRTLALVSSQRQEGRSFLAANLAVMFAQAGERTLLIDADLRRGRQHELFQLDNIMGLSSVLGGRADLSCASRITGLDDLFVLTAGAMPPNPQELLLRRHLTELLDGANTHFDIVIVDTPAWESGADAQIVASRTAMTVLVAQANRTVVRETAGLCEAIERSGGVLVGAALNDF